MQRKSHSLDRTIGGVYDVVVNNRLRRLEAAHSHSAPEHIVPPVCPVNACFLILQHVAPYNRSRIDAQAKLRDIGSRGVSGEVSSHPGSVRSVSLNLCDAILLNLKHYSLIVIHYRDRALGAAGFAGALTF